VFVEDNRLLERYVARLVRYDDFHVIDACVFVRKVAQVIDSRLQPADRVAAIGVISGTQDERQEHLFATFTRRLQDTLLELCWVQCDRAVP
jgi:hypothetical protein